MPSPDGAGLPPIAPGPADPRVAPPAAPALALWIRVLNAPFIGMIWVYRLTLSRLTGHHCRFCPSCSQYALEAYQTYPPVRAARLTLWRLARCQPLARGGYDPLPPPNTPRLDDHTPID